MPDHRDLPPSKRVQVVAFRSLRSGMLLGYVDIVLPPGLYMYDLPVFAGPNGRWVQLPSRTQANGDGQVRRDSRTGKPRFVPVAKWATRELAVRFSRFVISLLERDYASELTDRAA